MPIIVDDFECAKVLCVEQPFFKTATSTSIHICMYTSERSRAGAENLASMFKALGKFLDEVGLPAMQQQRRRSQ